MPPNIRVSRRSCLTFMSMSTELFSFWSDVQRDREIFIGSHFLHPIFRHISFKGRHCTKAKIYLPAIAHYSKHFVPKTSYNFAMMQISRSHNFRVFWLGFLFDATRQHNIFDNESEKDRDTIQTTSLAKPAIEMQFPCFFLLIQSEWQLIVMKAIPNVSSLFRVFGIHDSRRDRKLKNC